MTKEELIKNQFPNDEFLQSGVLQIVDKCIAGLEKENKELKTVKIPQLERRIASIRGAHSVDCRKLNARTEQVERLKKENAELQRNNKRLNKQYHIWNIKACNIDGELYNTKQKLDEAKEIIRLFLSERFNESEWQNIQNKAEQFLNSEVEK